MTEFKVDFLIIGAGFYGLYAAKILSGRGLNVLIIDISNDIMKRSSNINQARIHNGYHYPRSVSTASKTQEYFSKFIEEFKFCMKTDFRKIYGIAKNFSYTNAKQFEKFCSNVSIPCRPIDVEDIFQKSQIEAAYEVEEYAYDASILASHFKSELLMKKNVTFLPLSWIEKVERDGCNFCISLNEHRIVQTPRVLNATYASINAIHDLFSVADQKIKYELCEVVIGKPNEALSGVGVTIMDGPFLSTMPFGSTGKHSLTSVLHTPHMYSRKRLPNFPCQINSQKCMPELLDDCHTCTFRPKTMWVAMYKDFKKYFAHNLDLEYESSLFTVKAVLQDSEIDDKRPSRITNHQERPIYISVFAGKINCVFDLKNVMDKF
ncbi:NAD(P)/FAD-dependent oxidoreductase [Paracoccaceae bacterium]|nr:NAD(P)/FAD-dependent oxidoreductase [Paracoccaceae bacterium]